MVPNLFHVGFRYLHWFQIPRKFRISVDTEEARQLIEGFRVVAIPFSTSLHDLQESDDHLDRIWRGVMVRRNRHSFDSCLVRTHGEPETIPS